MGVVDVPGAQLVPINSVIQTTLGTNGGTNTTVTNDPKFVTPYDVTVNILASRAYPAFRQAAIVSQLLPLNLLGDYHLAGVTSPAYRRAAASTTVVWGSWTYTVNAPTPDIDGQPRPSGSGASRHYDAGSDQLP
jgi:hypothetical protein